jgi:hypothetical protein
VLWCGHGEADRRAYDCRWWTGDRRIMKDWRLTRYFACERGVKVYVTICIPDLWKSFERKSKSGISSSDRYPYRGSPGLTCSTSLLFDIKRAYGHKK